MKLVLTEIQIVETNMPKMRDDFRKQREYTSVPTRGRETKWWFHFRLIN